MAIEKLKTELEILTEEQLLTEEQFDKIMLHKKIPQKCLKIAEYLLDIYSDFERKNQEENSFFYLDLADLNLVIAESYGFKSKRLRFRLKSYMDDYEID